MPELKFDRLLTVDEVAIRMNVKPRFVRRLIHERRIEVRHLGKYVRIRESTVEAFIEAGTVPAVIRPGARRRAALWPVVVASAVSAAFPRAASRLVTQVRTALTAPHLTRSRARPTLMSG
jgi:excisionase family DNA binding protein